MCSALKRLNNHRKISTLLLSPCRRDVTDSDNSDGSKRLPRSLNINLTPLTNEDFVRVHGKALQNPKLSLGTDLQRTIGSVVKYLEQKWRNKVDASSQEKLTLTPKSGVILKKPIFLPVEPLTSEDLSLGKVTQEDREDEEEFYNHMEEDDQEDKILNFPWNSDCTLSVGEIYLMLGCGAGEETEVELNYTFKGEEEDKPFDKDDRYRTLNTLIKLVHDKFKKSKPLLSSEKDSNDEENFRRPAAPTPAATAFKQQLDLLLPKYNNRKGRPMSRKNGSYRLNNGAQHQRLLQPKFFMPSSKSEVKLRLLPQVKVTHPMISIQQPLSLQIPTYQVIATTTHQDSSSQFLLDSSSENHPTHSPPLSPTDSLSSLKSTDRFLDSVFENSNSSLLQTPPRLRSRPTSPFICEGSSSMSWSFPSSFSEGSLNSKSSRNGGTSIINEDSSHSTNSEVDRQLLCMMTESSVDFTSKFAKLASHITSDV
ncbi:uncharacterized protein [Lepeophtheirus salmonis]|uniref:uncharacterized protein n=1 Tax=Lepeophtheirus salmonis TaxID=72036 RepID=UPI003AF352AF